MRRLVPSLVALVLLATTPSVAVAKQGAALDYERALGGHGQSIDRPGVERTLRDARARLPGR